MPTTEVWIVMGENSDFEVATDEAVAIDRWKDEFGGEYEIDAVSLEKRIDGAHALNIIDDIERDDAHLMRRVRNKFAHEKDRLHFDKPKIVALLQQMSTYEAAEHNQDAFLHPAGNVSEQIGKAVQALRKEPVEGKNP